MAPGVKYGRGRHIRKACKYGRHELTLRCMPKVYERKGRKGGAHMRGRISKKRGIGRLPGGECKYGMHSSGKCSTRVQNRRARAAYLASKK